MSGVALSVGGSPQGWQFVGGATAHGTGSTPSLGLTTLTGGIATAAQAGDLVTPVIALDNGTNRNITVTTAGFVDRFAGGGMVTNSARSKHLQFDFQYDHLAALITSVQFDLDGYTGAWVAAAQVWRGSSATPHTKQGGLWPDNEWGNTETAASIPPLTGFGLDNQLAVAFGAYSHNSTPAFTAPAGMGNLVQMCSGNIGVALCSKILPTAQDFSSPDWGGVGSPYAWAAGSFLFNPA